MSEIGELYVGAEDKAEKLTAPAPVITTEPAPNKIVYADQNVDGSIKDITGSALGKSDAVQIRYVDEPGKSKVVIDQLGKPADTPAAVTNTDTSTATSTNTATTSAAPVSTSTATATATSTEAVKLYANKYKSVEELENAYKLAEKAIHLKSQEAAESKRKADELAKAPPVKSAEQIEREKQEANNTAINEFVQDPEAYNQKQRDQATQQTLDALETQKRVDQWSKDNADVAPYGAYVGYEMQRLAAEDPSLATDGNTLLQKATESVRTAIGHIRAEGRNEALTTRETVVPLTTGNAPPATEHSSTKKTPMTADEAYEATMQMLKGIEKINQGGLQPRR